MVNLLDIFTQYLVHRGFSPRAPCLTLFLPVLLKHFAWFGAPFPFRCRILIHHRLSWLSPTTRLILPNLFFKFILAGSSVLSKCLNSILISVIYHILFIYLRTSMPTYGPTICPFISIVHPSYRRYPCAPPGLRGTVSVTYVSTLCRLLFAIATAHIIVHCIRLNGHDHTLSVAHSWSV